MIRPLPLFPAALLVLISVLPGYGANPALIVFPDGAALSDRVRSLEATGAKVRTRIPPSVVVAELPDGKPSVPGAQAVYTGAVPLSVLEPLGAAAVAAGINWNRQVLNTAVEMGFAAGALRQSVAARSLPAPAGLTAAPLADRIRCAWEPVAGASFYEVQVSADPSFSSVYAFTSAREPAVNLPLPDAPGTAHVRVRAADPGQPGSDDDFVGPWAKPVAAAVPSVPSVSGAAPVPTSPANGVETRGYTLLLEWAGSAATRVQVSRSADFSTTVFDEIVDAAPYACASQALSTGDSLHWRVRSEGPFRSEWSGARRVSIGEARHEATDAFVNPEAAR